METSKARKSLSFVLAIIMLFTMIPTTIFTFATGDDLPVMKSFNAASGDDFHKYYKQVYTVTFLDEIDTAAMEGALEKWDISATPDSGEVMSWMYLNEEATAAAGEHVKASPRARAAAEKAGVDLRLAVPTGPNGRIIERDVRALQQSGVRITSAAMNMGGEAAAQGLACHFDHCIARAVHAYGVIGALHQPGAANFARALAGCDGFAVLEYLYPTLYLASVGREEVDGVVAVGLGHVLEFKVGMIQIGEEQRVGSGQRKRAGPESRREQQNQQHNGRPCNLAPHLNSFDLTPWSGIPAWHSR